MQKLLMKLTQFTMNERTWKKKKKKQMRLNENVFEWMKKLNCGHITHLLHKVQTTVQMGASARLVSTKVLISRWTCGVTIHTRVQLKHSNTGIWKYQLHDPCRCHKHICHRNVHITLHIPHVKSVCRVWLMLTALRACCSCRLVSTSLYRMWLCIALVEVMCQFMPNQLVWNCSSQL